MRESVTEAAKASVLCWLATVSAEGVPNVSPKEVFAAPDEGTLLVADIASPVTVRNLRATGRACASFIDIFRQTGWKLTGRAEVIAPADPRFATLAAPLEAITQGEFPIRHVIRLTVDSRARIIAPSYRLFPDRTVAERVESAMRRYGVRPAGDA